MDNGWIKLHRKILGNPIFKRPNYLVVWLYLLLKANHKQEKIMWNGDIIIIKEGQILTGRDKIAEATGVPTSTIEDILNYLEKSQHQIQQQKTTKFRIITIINWVSHQQPNIKSNNKATTKQQQSNTNKKDKNDKNDKNTTKVVQKESFGNPDINKITEHLKQSIKGSLDGSQAENRRYAHLLLKRFEKDYPGRVPAEVVCFLIDRGAEDRFHAKNLTNFKYLYYNAQKIIQSVKGDLNTNQIVKIS
jgi:hypothetical protein